MTPEEARQVFTSLGELKAQNQAVRERLDQVVTDLSAFIKDTRELWHNEMNKLQKMTGETDIRLMQMENFRNQILDKRRNTARWLGLIGLGIGSGLVEALHWLRGH